jgi:hypothetical protein
LVATAVFAVAAVLVVAAVLAVAAVLFAVAPAVLVEPVLVAPAAAEPFPTKRLVALPPPYRSEF